MPDLSTNIEADIKLRDFNQYIRQQSYEKRAPMAYERELLHDALDDWMDQL